MTAVLGSLYLCWKEFVNSKDLNVIPISLGLKHLLVMMFGNKKPRITQWHSENKESEQQEETLGKKQFLGFESKTSIGILVTEKHMSTSENLGPQMNCITCMITYIHTLGAGGSPKVLWVGYCEWLKFFISLWRNASFWRSHSLHRIVFCADDFFWSACWLIKNPSFIHLYLWETCDLCGKMTILEMLWCSKCSKVLWATVFLEVVS